MSTNDKSFATWIPEERKFQLAPGVTEITDEALLGMYETAFESIDDDGEGHHVEEVSQEINLEPSRRDTAEWALGFGSRAAFLAFCFFMAWRLAP
ncbi:hypothetical protein [Nannocystis sp. SCPEA4]|uniref:hypothetical protein n=1 Tax=Nannocystis sp. SCPEA4 TaxID=2996787 RepID=UPI002271F4A8|nr:hypothetical protein [Nannocystis sp. SCPEA4]MCY1055424.1 hypothetical protein [Nannocystis sp. SCPEA4]